MKRKRRRPLKRRRPARPFRARLPLKSLPASLLSPKAKLLTTGGLAAVVLILLGIFIARGDTNAQYVLVLSSTAFVLFLWALPRVELGLVAVFLFSQPLLIYLGNTEYGYTKAIYSLLFISLLAVIRAGRWALAGRATLQLTPLWWPAALVLIAALLSLINSESLLGDLQYVVLIVYFLLFYLILANSLEHPGEILFLIGVLLASSALASLYALLQYFGVLLGTPGAAHGTGAIISTFGNKNYLGGFLSYLFAPGLLLLFRAESPWTRGFTVGSLGLMFTTLVAIDSDSAWLALILSLFVLMGGLLLRRQAEPLGSGWGWGAALWGISLLLTLGLLAGSAVWVQGEALSTATVTQLALRFSPLAWLGLGVIGLFPLVGWLMRSFRSSRRWGWAGLIASIIAIGGFLITPTGQDLTGRLWTLVVKGSARVRAEDWWVGYEMFKAQPLVGVGLGDYKREFLNYKAQFLTTERGQHYKETVGYILRAAQAHNEYVQIGAELGLLGLLAAAFLIAMIFRSARQRLLQQAQEQRWITWGLLAGAAAFMSDSFFSFPLHLPANALAFVFLLGALQSKALGGGSRPALPLGKRASRALFASILVLALGVSVLAYRDWRADTYLDRGIRQFKLAKLEEAKALFEESLKLDFAPAEALYWLGLIHFQQGDLKRSREYFLRSLSSQTLESTYFYLARIYEQEGDLTTAQSYVEELLRIDPAPSLKQDALQLQALLLYKQGAVEEGIARLKELSEETPSPRLLATLGQMYLEQGLIEEARQSFEKALKLIDQKLKHLEKKLRPGATLSLDDFHRLSSERTLLKQLKEQLEQTLRSLSPSP